MKDKPPPPSPSVRADSKEWPVRRQRGVFRSRLRLGEDTQNQEEGAFYFPPDLPACGFRGGTVNWAAKRVCGKTKCERVGHVFHSGVGQLRRIRS